MEHREGKSKLDRREIHSVCMPVPTIVLNSSAAKQNEQTTLSHSRSAGDLDMVLSDTDDYQVSGQADGICKFSGSVSGSIQNSDQRNAIGLYCSPRMLRRSGNSQEDCPQKRHSGMFIETLNACSLNCLDPGSRVGSTVSLNSEYTSRSIGLISNDSNSECSQHCQSGVMDGTYHRHNVLKRFYSTPEKDDDLLNYQTQVRRNSKSMGNMQKEDMHNFVSFDFGSDSTDGDIPNFDQGQDQSVSCDIDDTLALRTGSAGDDEEGNNDADADGKQTLVKAVTGSVTMRDGRIRKWLTEIRDPDENSNL